MAALGAITGIVNQGLGLVRGSQQIKQARYEKLPNQVNPLEIKDNTNLYIVILFVVVIVVLSIVFLKKK